MKTILLLLAFSMICPADEMRTWTQRFTGKTLEARLVEKDAEGVLVRIAPAKGKPSWVKLADLSEEDAAYAGAWQPKPDNFRPLEVILIREINDGYRRVIRVRAMSRAEPLKLHVHFSADASNAKRIEVAPYSMEEIEVQVYRNWRAVVLNEAGEVLFEELGGKK